MVKFLSGAVLAMSLGLVAPFSCLAADAWLLDTSVPGAPKAGVNATLTYLDPATSKTVNVKYVPAAVKVLIERDVDGEPSRHKTSVTLTMGSDASLSLNAGMLGSGLKIGKRTTLNAAINPETDTDFPFQFSDTSSRSMAADAVTASSAQGYYVETVDNSGTPTGLIKFNVTYTVVGNLDITDIPARLTVKINASNVQPRP